MEKISHPAEKPGSFIGRHARRKSEVNISPKTSDVAASDADTTWRETVEHVDDLNAAEISLSIDEFTSTLSSLDKKSTPSDAPDDFVETFAKIVESKIVKYYSADKESKFGKRKEADALFLEYVSRVFKLTAAFGEFEAGTVRTVSLYRMSVVLQRAMVFLEEELRGLVVEVEVSVLAGVMGFAVCFIGSGSRSE